MAADAPTVPQGLSSLHERLDGHFKTLRRTRDAHRGAIAWIMSSQPTRAATRYFVAGEAVVVAGAVTGELFIVFLFVLQLILWAMVIGLVAMFVFGLLASLAGG
jgi:uncharacterized membrane protein YdbT with pleckstrin-like domain